MVAEVGTVEMEPISHAPKTEKEEMSPAEKLHAKRAAMVARKRATSSFKFAAVNQPTKEQKSGDNPEKIKKKKYLPAPWLCEDMFVKSVASVRSDVDDAAAFLAGKSKPGSDSGHRDVDNDVDEGELEMMYRTRLKKKSNLSPKVKYLPLNYVTKRKLQDVIRGYGRNTVIKSVDKSRLKERDVEINYAKERRNANTSLMLVRLDLKRKTEFEPVRAEQPATTETKKTKTKPNYSRQQKDKCKRNLERKPRWSQEQRERQTHVPHEFEIHEGIVECDDPEETDLMCFLLDLQHREMTPEDYEMLLRLDDKIAPKTIAIDKLASLRSETISDAEAENGPDGMPWKDYLCAVCMDAYENGHVVKFLPCEHFFHSQCIEMWLKNSGNICPLDGMEV